MNPYTLIGAQDTLIHLDLSSRQIEAALIANLRHANLRKQAVTAYCLTGRGGAVTKTSQARLKREAARRVERAKIALDEARAVVARLKRATDKIPWAGAAT